MLKRLIGVFAIAAMFLVAGAAGVDFDAALDAVPAVDTELTAEAASADPPGPQSYCTHEGVGPWHDGSRWHFWEFREHYNVRDYYGRWRHVHNWRHYIWDGWTWVPQHDSPVYC